MQTIDFIYFDLGKVILEFDHARGCRQVSSVSGVPLERVKKVIFDSGLQNQYETGAISCDDFHAAFCQETGGEVSQTQLLTAISDIFEPNQQIFPLITQLRAVNFPIGILSNTCRAHWDLVHAQYRILRECFNPIVLSFEVKSMKPDLKIYDRAIEIATRAGKTCFFVDDKQENVDGANEAGMDAVLYRSVPELIKALTSRGVSINL